MMIKDLVIIGAGGFGREASLLMEEINEHPTSNFKWNLLGFIDEDQNKWGLNKRGYKVLGGLDYLHNLPTEVSIIIVISDPAVKERLVNHELLKGRQFTNLIHPEIYLSRDISIGEGVLINKGCIITTNIAIGNHVSINPGCGIGHDVLMSDFVTLMWRVNISGMVNLSKSCVIGSGATVLQGKRIGAGSIIGAGSVVTTDIPAKSTAMGIPARVK